MKDHEHEDLDTEEIAVAAYNKIDALLDLLIKKKIGAWPSPRNGYGCKQLVQIIRRNWHCLVG